MNAPNIRILPDTAAVARAAADLVAASAERALAERPQWTCALSGGSTPRATFQLLARPPYVGRIDWRRVHLFWGDERAVPPDHPDSNYGMTYATLIENVPIPEENVHRILAELPAVEAARQYEATIRAVFGVGPEQIPRFDFVMLGMGPDGHTASLFPGTQALEERHALVVANHVPRLDADRITLTLPLLDNARAIVFLVAGSEKAATLAAVLQGEPRPTELPSQLIQPVNGTLTWLVDEAAAAQIHR